MKNQINDNFISIKVNKNNSIVRNKKENIVEKFENELKQNKYILKSVEKLQNRSQLNPLAKLISNKNNIIDTYFASKFHLFGNVLEKQENILNESSIKIQSNADEHKMLDKNIKNSENREIIPTEQIIVYYSAQKTDEKTNSMQQELGEEIFDFVNNLRGAHSFGEHQNTDNFRSKMLIELNSANFGSIRLRLVLHHEELRIFLHTSCPKQFDRISSRKGEMVSYLNRKGLKIGLEEINVLFEGVEPLK